MSVDLKVSYRHFGILCVMAAALMFTHCAKQKQSGCNKSYVQIKVGIMKEKLNLNDNQASKFKSIIHEIHSLTNSDRKKFNGNDEALLKAAKERNNLKIQKIESILDEKQKIKFREIMAQKQLSERTVLMGEKLGLDCEVTEKLNSIVEKSPTDEEALEIKKSGDVKRIKAFMVNLRKTNKEIEALLTDEQKKEFNKIFDEKMSRIDNLVKKG